VKGAQHKDPTLAPIEGEASQQRPFLFSFHLPGREGKGDQGEQRKKKKKVKKGVSHWLVGSE